MSPSSLRGIESIELLPGDRPREVVSLLSSSLKSATSLRAAVAYWCVGPKQFGPNLIKRLTGDGFLCVDVHLPTDINILAAMVSAGANVFLYLKTPNPQPDELKLKFPPHLMHSKILLFEYAEAPAELWIGSHNWTARALTGVNTEASLRVRMKTGAFLHHDASAFLARVRTDCIAFNLKDVEYYKWLQGASLEEPMWVMELSGSQSLLEAHKKVTVFGRSEQDYRNLKSVDKNIVISLQDAVTNRESLYEATVIDTGYLSDSGFTFDSRLYAVHRGASRHSLNGPAVPPATIRGKASSWATISFVDKLVGSTFELPPTERWVVDNDETDRPTLPNLKDWFAKPDKPLVMHAVPPEIFENPNASADSPTGRRSLITRGPTSSERALVANQDLLRKKIVRAKRSDGEAFVVSRSKKTKDEL